MVQQIDAAFSYSIRKQELHVVMHFIVAQLECIQTVQAFTGENGSAEAAAHLLRTGVVEDDLSPDLGGRLQPEQRR